MDADAKVNIKKIVSVGAVVYIAMVVLFYWLAGEQLHLRQSRGNISMPVAETGAVELSQGVVVEQEFAARIMRLKSVSVQWGTYYRANAGTVTMELYNLSDGSLIVSQGFDAAAITEGSVTTLEMDTPVETVWETPLMLKVYSDSLPGTSVAPLMSASVNEDGFSLKVNGSSVDGMLCFSAEGEDYIWTGLHYWELAAGLGLFIALAAAVLWIRWKKGKRSYIIGALEAMKKYHFLIRQLVSRDFKTKYKRSVLGMFWSFLNPLLTMTVQFVVFSRLFKTDITNYQVYLITGIVIFNFFSESTSLTLSSIVGNAGLITKVYMPKYIYPLTRVLSSMVNLLMSLLPLFIVVIVSGIVPTKAYLLIPYVLFCLLVFCLGIGMFLSAAMVFFRDIQFLWGVLSMIWMYMTPIFYPENILPEEVAWILKFNPLYYFISFMRTCVMEGISPEPRMYGQCFLFAFITLLVGALVFQKSQDRFVLYL